MLQALRTRTLKKRRGFGKSSTRWRTCRNAINPIRVLHEAVRLAGIAKTGPLLPLLSNLPQSEHGKVQAAARELLEADHAA